MRRYLLALMPLLFLVSACSSGSNTEAIRASEEYVTVSDYWDTFPLDWELDVCGQIADQDDKEGLEKAMKVMKLMLKVNLSIDTDITKDDAYAAAIRLLLTESC
jgi:hypothetical protein